MESSEGIGNGFSDPKNHSKVIFESSDDQDSAPKTTFISKSPLATQGILNLDETEESSNNLEIEKRKVMKLAKIPREGKLEDTGLTYIKGLKSDLPLLSDKLSVQSTDSSSIPKKPQLRTQVSEKWDNLELYFKILESKKENENKNAGKRPNSLPLKILQIIANFKKGDPFSFISDTAVLKVFFVSSLMLFVQLKYSKKARIWLFYTLNIVLYLVGLTLSAGTLTLLALKIRSATKKSREKKTVENQNCEQKPLEKSENVSHDPEPSSEVK